MLNRLETLDLYAKLFKDVSDNQFHQLAKELAKKDLFFLLTQILKKDYINNDWGFLRCLEVAENPDGRLDLWARGHLKSTIITFGLSIQDVLNDPEITVGIFAHTRAISKAFLDQIKRELEGNELLKSLFPETLYNNPDVESPRWSLENGIIVKRKNNPKEASFEAWSLESLPTGKHFQKLVFDDLVTEDSISPEAVEKSTQQWELSLNLSIEDSPVRYVGTRYSPHDLYEVIIEREAAIPRIRQCYDEDNNPLFMTKEHLDEMRKKLGPYTFASQYLLDPLLEGNAKLQEVWLKYYPRGVGGWGSYNRYILIDPANTKNKRSDYTVIMVIGLGVDNNYYILDIVRDKLSLTERSEILFDKVQEYKPLAVGYERYSAYQDFDYLKQLMNERNFRFKLIELGIGRVVNKQDRILNLVPLFENSRIYLPQERDLQYTDYEGKLYFPVKEFLKEYLVFPYTQHDDILDALSRILDNEMHTIFPNRDKTKYKTKKVAAYNPFR